MNAIILAAGLGSRFQQLTQHQHKALFPVGGKPNLVRHIEMLRQAGIDDIIVITGHLAEQLDAVCHPLGVKTYYNPHYATRNNLYSFSLALDDLSNSFVLDADVVLFENIFRDVPKNRALECVVVRPGGSAEWLVHTDEAGRIEYIDVADRPEPSLLGVSYWPQQEAQYLKAAIAAAPAASFEDPKRYWTDVERSLIESGEMAVYAHLLAPEVADELDRIEDYERILAREVSTHR